MAMGELRNANGRTSVLAMGGVVDIVIIALIIIFIWRFS
jgi:hypothetical protein